MKYKILIDMAVWAAIIFGIIGLVILLRRRKDDSN
jgi:hypothetical protein